MKKIEKMNRKGDENWDIFIKVAIGITVLAFLVVGLYYLFKKLGVA